MVFTELPFRIELEYFRTETDCTPIRRLLLFLGDI
jgi:hypothetical protein